MTETRKELLHSCDKTKDLYFYILNLSIALKKAADSKIEAGLKKFHPTEEEKNPNRKFSENLFTKYLQEDRSFIDYCEKNGLVWGWEMERFVKKLYGTIAQKDYFVKYMNSPERSLAEDCKLFLEIYRQELEDNEELEQILEDSSIYWMDDLSYVLIQIVKNIGHFKSRSVMSYPDTFLKEDDKEFAENLLTSTFVNYEKYQKLFTDNVSNWDADRLVATDITLIILGISEAVNFPGIPVKVTINEYVEISKFYSTNNSKVFVNGLLDKIIQQLLKSGEIVKAGRGLIES